MINSSTVANGLAIARSTKAETAKGFLSTAIQCFPNVTYEKSRPNLALSKVKPKQM